MNEKFYKAMRALEGKLYKASVESPASINRPTENRDRYYKNICGWSVVERACGWNPTRSK